MVKGNKIDIEVNFTDSASAKVKMVTEQVKKASKSVGQSAKKASKEEQQANKQTQDAHVAAYKKMLQAKQTLYTKAEMYGKRLAAVEKTLGVRTEKEIQAEIRKTQQAYQLLARSGTASAADLRRAWAATQLKMKELNAEMGRMSAGQHLGNMGRGLAGIAAGIGAGAMVLREPVRKEMSYDRELAMVANTAFSDRDVAGRIAGKKALHQAVKRAVENGGGTKEEALSALDTLLASGTVSAETAMNLLPTLQKGAVATGADTADLAKIAISSMQQFGIGEDQIGQVLDMAVAAGQAGNFELKDMARWLPQQMAAAKSAGLTGIDGLKSLLVANQQARVTAGSSDAAGNNLANLLAKITSKETNERFKKIDYVDKNGKKREINFAKSMEAYKAKGQDSLEAFMSIMDDVVGNNQAYKELQKRLKTAKKEDQIALLNQMTNLVEGTAIGQVISDRQALMALLGIRNNVQLGKEVKEQVENSQGAVDTSHQVIKATNDYNVEDLKNAAEFAQMESMKGFNNTLGDVSGKLADYAKAYPELATAIAGAATGIGALGAAAFAAAGSVALLGKGNGSWFDWLKRSPVKTAGGGVGGEAAASAAGTAGTGLLAPLVAGAIGLFYSPELNKGEDDFIDLQQKVQQGTATPSELAKFDTMGAKTRQEVDDNRAKREKAFSGRPALNESQLAEYQRSLAPYMVELKRQEDIQLAKDLAHARNVANGFGGLFASEEEKQQARALLDKHSTKPSKPSYEGVANAVEHSQDWRQSVGELSSGYGRFATSLQSSLSQDIQTFGQQISDGLKQAINSQEHTIKNLITVELDGRVVAEQVSEQQFRYMVRG